MRKLKGALRFKSEGKRSTSTLPPICATQYCAMGQILVYVSTEQMWVTKKNDVSKHLRTYLYFYFVVI